MTKTNQDINQLQIVGISEEPRKKHEEARDFLSELTKGSDLIAEFEIGSFLWVNQQKFLSEIYWWLRRYASDGQLSSLTFSFVEDPTLLVFHLETRSGQQSSGEDPDEWDNFA